ncbi:Raf kinase inhibitor-like YbhB/YbcL family protein [Methanolinea mesophila]|uniref:YbhB/YbcL family Raf kinase inhibitor-like protein n=1 Tax=Methanolinea mesophila TaxID=547055 RepID=UPI001AE8B849|nr:YbhB/YbcL family Raf kinase inhibitor-like protein [Methanolinea mesophila]MBP1927955.1 Raf kinase inhibitor-like YbhB/YbcL family protein [Methanolinea mesophila]
MENLSIKFQAVNLPVLHTCDGEDLSPPFEVSGIDTNRVVTIAVVMSDPDASGGFTHWVIWNLKPHGKVPAAIPPEPVVMTPVEAIQGKNSYGLIGYSGPCPPQGQTHRYDFKVYGLDTTLGLAPGATKPELLKAIEGHVVQYGEGFVVYGK